MQSTISACVRHSVGRRFGSNDTVRPPARASAASWKTSSRVAGETAPLLFTSLGNNAWSTDLTKPMSSLPLASGWPQCRDIPVPQAKTFPQMWKDRRK